jgi:hypothetical protein
MTINEIMKLADAYADAADHRWGHKRCALKNAIARIIAERDTLAAGVENCYCTLQPNWASSVMKAALEVTRRLKAASEPANVSPLAEKVQRMRAAVKEVHTWGRDTSVARSATAIEYIAAVVEELAKEGK